MAIANKNTGDRLRYSVSLVQQGKNQFYTLTMPSDVLSRTCRVSTRAEDPIKGFQRELDEKRAIEIAEYVDAGGTIPNSIVLSAQPEAKLQIVGRGKTVEFSDVKGAFFMLDGQHRVYGFSKARTRLRVPVVIYNNLTRKDETKLFIDINTKQRPVPNALLLDIKSLAEIETDSEATLREIFDDFDKKPTSALKSLTSRHETSSGKINRVTFNSAVKPLLAQFPSRSPDGIYEILNNYLSAVATHLADRASEPLLGKPVIFRAFVGLFHPVATRVKDKFDGQYSAGNFESVLAPIFHHFPNAKLKRPGQSWVALRDYLEKRMSTKTTF
ncbi:MAG: DGQHR domain-containing protein [Alphaproteobacteria bacterium]